MQRSAGWPDRARVSIIVIVITYRTSTCTTYEQSSRPTAADALSYEWYEYSYTVQYGSCHSGCQAYEYVYGERCRG